MRYKKCEVCKNTYSINEDNYRLYKYKDRVEYCNTCVKCEKEKKSEYQRNRYKKMKQCEYDFSAKDWEECLIYFEHKDAYTGMPLVSPTMDHIIPVTQYGGTIKNNIVPCNAEINGSKSNQHMIRWYKAQDFYSEGKLSKILDWMDYYKKYLYIPIEQRKYIEADKSKSIYHFTITLPNGYRKKIYYPSKGNPQKLTLLLKKSILDDWEDYFNSNWLPINSSEDYYSAYNKVKTILDRCGTFLVMNSKDKDRPTITKADMQKIKINELSLDGNWQDEEIETSPEERIGFLNEHEKENHSTDSVILKTPYDNEPVAVLPSRKVKSKTTKMFNIYSEDEKEFDDYDEIHISNTFNVWKQATRKIPARKGLIDKSKPYISEWCIVDTENVFKFNNNKYKISEQVSQYNIRTKKPNHDDYRNDYQMDKVLVYEQDDKLFFFDQNIEQIKNENIGDYQSK